MILAKDKEVLDFGESVIERPEGYDDFIVMDSPRPDQDYLPAADGTWFLPPEIAFERQKEVDAKEVRERWVKDAFAPVPVSVSEGDFVFKGGERSAAGIQGAVELAQSLGEEKVKVWDVEKIVHELSFESALFISAQIGKAYRDASIAKQNALFEIINRVFEKGGEHEIK